MVSLKATTNVLHKRAAPYLVVAFISTLPATSALADPVDGDLIVKGQACVGSDCTTDTFPNDPLRIHGPEPVLSMVDSSSDGPDRDWSIGITDAGGPSEFFVRDEVSGAQVLRMNVDGAVALGANAELVTNPTNAVSVGSGGNERRVAHVADAEDPTDAVNMRQFEAFQARALESVGGDADELDRQLQEMNDRIDDLAARIDRLASEVQ